ncbi:ribonuclease H-like domain-containing protein [Mycena epipterygia]|nr:ribonuclease H-like domain-containing protein [Mycena epipterygia]
MSWMELPLGQYQAVESSKTLSYNQREVMINHKDIIFHPREGRWNKSIPLRILSFDIETMVRADNQFTPYHQTAEMPVIQIGNVVEHGQRSFRSVFTLDGCTKIAGAQVNSFPNEASMLHAWKQFIIASDPDLITGHNIGRFDFVYLIFRAEVLGLQDFSCLGRLKGLNAKAVKMRSQAEKRPWKDAPVLSGRLQIDTFQYIEERNIRNNFLKRSYTLDAVARDFLKSSKEDLPFQIINSLQEGSDDDRKRLAVYCLKDAHLPLRLLERPGRDADCLPALEEAIAAARAQKFIHIPFSDFLREGRNRTY